MGKENIDEKFDKFIENDFAHVQSDISNLKKEVSFIKGFLTIIGPLTIALLFTLIGVILGQ